MSKQRLARRIRKGARYAMERHARNVRPPPLPLPGERPRRALWPYVIALAVLVAVLAYARCGHAGPLEDFVESLGGGWAGVLAFLSGIALGCLIVFGSWAACNLIDALRGIVAYLFRKDR